MLKIDSHTHPFQTERTLAGLCSYAEYAIECGFSGIVFTEHAPMCVPNSSHYLTEQELEDYLLFSAECQKKYADKLQIVIGLECDYLPENMDYLTCLLDRFPVDYVGGSLHFHAAFWQKHLAGMDAAARTKFALRQLLDMVNTGVYDTVSHLDFFRWKQTSYQPELFEDDFRALFEAMLCQGTALEWNSSGLLKEFASALPCDQVWQWSKDYPLRRVFGSDAHQAKWIGYQWERYEEMLKS